VTRRLLAVIAGCATLILANDAWAQTRTWVGGSGPNWSTPTNWNPAGPPVTGNTLVFPPGPNTTSVNDLSALSINAMTISGSGYTISGNPLTVTNAPGIEFTTAGTATLSLDVTLTTELVRVVSGGELRLTGILTAKSLDKRGPGTLRLSNANALGNLVTEPDCGVIAATHPLALGTAGNLIDLMEGCTLRVEASTTLNKQLDLRGHGAPGTTGVLEVVPNVTLTLQIDLQGKSPTTSGVLSGGTLNVQPGVPIQLQSPLTMNVAGTATINRSIGGNNDLIKTNAGALILTDTNNFNGDTRILSGSVFINGRQQNSQVRLEGGTVAGTGTAGTITAITGGAISPGMSGPGTLSSRDVTMNGGTTFTVQVSGAQSDRLEVTGTVALNNAQLSVSGTLPSAPVVIISNDGGEPVNGTFAGIPEGATVPIVGGGAGTISYTGGDGNDVVLRPGFVPPPITISPATLPNGRVGVPYSQSVTASGGIGPPYTGSISQGVLPPGLTAVGSGAAGMGTITGTPTQAGTFTFTVTVADAQKNTAAKQYSITIDPAATIVLSPLVLPDGVVPLPYSQTITASGGTGPYAFTVTQGTLPPGLTLDVATGALSGRPTTDGTFNFTVTATDANGAAGIRGYVIAIGSQALSITLSPTTLPNGTVGSAYSQTITATGGVSPYAFDLPIGALPPGLTLNAAGLISGTPTTVGSFTLTVSATDATSLTGGRNYTVTIGSSPTPPITLSPTTLPGGTVGVAYSQSITASGGVGPPYTGSIIAGTLPAGLTFTGGLLSGTPTTAGSFSFTVTATDSADNSGSQAYTVAINASVSPITITPTTLPNGTVGVPYSQTVTAAGGAPPYKGSTTGTLAPGLTAALLPGGASAIVSGTPTRAGTFTFSVVATDTQSSLGSQSYTVTIVAAPVTIVVGPPSLPNGVVNVPYSQTIMATGGTGAYTFAVTTGALPAGLTLNEGTGAISGTPTSPTTANFTITATDSANNTGNRAYALTITATATPPITLSPTTLPDGTVGAPYAQTVTALGGVGPPYTLSITSGTLPTGLTFTGGLLSGTPAIAGAYTFTVTAVDGATNSGSQAYTVTIRSGGTLPPITVGPESLPSPVVGQRVQTSVTAAGGDGGPYTLAITAGALPPGLSMTTGGVISGTPTTPGSYSFTVTATDASGNSGTRTYTGAVSATPVPVLPWWVLAVLAYFGIRLAASRVRRRTT
jgi:hypothetical protein